MSDRMTRLMLSAARDYDKGADPFSPERLEANKVTFSECMDLATAISGAIRFSVTANRVATVTAEKRAEKRTVAGTLCGGGRS